jgi:hypothetical protein
MTVLMRHQHRIVNIKKAARQQAEPCGANTVKWWFKKSREVQTLY